MTAPAHRARLLQAYELVRFAAVGATVAVLYVALYSGLVWAGVPFLLATVLAFLPLATAGYLLHDRWTFRTKTPSRQGLARWLLLQGSLLALNGLALWALVEHAELHRVVAQILVMPFLPPVTYLLSRRRVFGAA